MALSTQSAVSDGTLVLLPISIDYLDRSEITVTFDDVEDAYPWEWVGVSDATIAFDPAVPATVEVRIKRTTNMAAVRHLFSQGAAFTAESVDENAQQVLHIAQEASEGQLGGDFFQDINMHLHKVTNMEPGTAPGEAVEFAQLAVHDAEIIGYRDAAAASAAAAAASFDNFDDRYLGPKAVDPTLDNDGNALLEGAIYWTTAGKKFRVYNGAAWQDAVSAVASGVAVIPAGGLAATDVQAALEELDTEKSSVLHNHDASLISYTPTGTGAVATNVQAKLREFVSVKDFGAVGDGVADDTAAIQAAINAFEKGVLYFPPGDYRVTAKISINNKNDQNDGTARNFAIEGYGARLVSAVTSAVAYELRANKGLAMHGLQFTGEATGWVDIEGLWNSTLTDVTFGQTVKFSSLNTSTFDSHYWNTFNTCYFTAGIEFHVGTEGVDRTEFNANNFYNCRIWGGTYAISVYGTAYLRSNNFYGCDVSYYSSGFLYVDQVVSGGELNFYGGFFDTVGEWVNGSGASSTNNITVNFIGPAAMPNAYSLGNKIDYATRQTIDAVGGARGGGRLPTSSINLMRGGNLAVWNGTTPVGTGVTGGGTATKQTGGLFGTYLNYQAATGGQYVEVAAIAAPFSGTYSCTIIARKNSGAVNSATYIGGVAQTYGVVTFSGTDISVSSFNVTLTAGQAFSVRIYTDGAAGNFDVFYVGLCLGRQSQIASAGATLYGSTTYDPPSLADGTGTTTTVTCPSARPGMFAQAGFTNDLQGITVSAWVSASDTVSVRFQNETGGPLDLASGTLNVKASW